MKLLTSTPFVYCIIVAFTDHCRQVQSFTNLIQRNTHGSLCLLQEQLDIKQGFGTFEFLNIDDEKKSNNDNDVAARNKRVAILHDYSGQSPIAYQTMWDVQKKHVDSHIERLKLEREAEIFQSQFLTSNNVSNDMRRNVQSYNRPEGYDSIIMLQHEPVYTLGTGADPKFVKSPKGIDVVYVERGGEVTYHGPGQLVAYPILDLRGYRKDIHWYVRALEEAIIIALESVGVQGARREDGVTGVWVNNKKIGAIGVKVRRWVTMHGLSVNVDQRSLANFEGIVPCGLVGREVCCINDLLEKPITVEDFASHLSSALETVFEVELVAKK